MVPWHSSYCSYRQPTRHWQRHCWQQCAPCRCPRPVQHSSTACLRRASPAQAFYCRRSTTPRGRTFSRQPSPALSANHDAISAAHDSSYSCFRCIRSRPHGTALQRPAQQRRTQPAAAPPPRTYPATITGMRVISATLLAQLRTDGPATAVQFVGRSSERATPVRDCSDRSHGPLLGRATEQKNNAQQHSVQMQQLWRIRSAASMYTRKRGAATQHRLPRSTARQDACKLTRPTMCDAPALFRAGPAVHTCGAPTRLQLPYHHAGMQHRVCSMAAKMASTMHDGCACGHPARTRGSPAERALLPPSIAGPSSCCLLRAPNALLLAEIPAMPPPDGSTEVLWRL
jgi:hypothetical protein